MTMILSGTNGGTFPSWTTAGRPASPAVGQFGYNTTIGQFDCYTSGGWVTVLNSGSPQSQLPANIAGNGPAMQAYASITQSVTQFTGTVIQVNTEVFDTNGCFNNTGSTVTLNGLSVPAYSFCPNVAGYYQVNGQTIIQSTTGVCETYIYKNGATVAYGASGASDAGSCLSTVSMVVYLNGTGDYIQLATWHNNGTAKNTTVGATGFNNMSIALVRAA